MAEQGGVLALAERIINDRIDSEIARANSYKMAGKKLAGEGAGYCDYAAKILLQVRTGLRAALSRSPDFKASDSTESQMIATGDPAIAGERPTEPKQEGVEAGPPNAEGVSTPNHPGDESCISAALKKKGE